MHTLLWYPKKRISDTRRAEVCACVNICVRVRVSPRGCARARVCACAHGSAWMRGIASVQENQHACVCEREFTHVCACAQTNLKPMVIAIRILPTNPAWEENYSMQLFKKFRQRWSGLKNAMMTVLEAHHELQEILFFSTTHW